MSWKTSSTVCCFPIQKRVEFVWCSAPDFSSILLRITLTELLISQSVPVSYTLGAGRGCSTGGPHSRIPVRVMELLQRQQHSHCLNISLHGFLTLVRECQTTAWVLSTIALWIVLWWLSLSITNQVDQCVTNINTSEQFKRSFREALRGLQSRSSMQMSATTCNAVTFLSVRSQYLSKHFSAWPVIRSSIFFNIIIWPSSSDFHQAAFRKGL